MHKIDKAILKLSGKERMVILALLAQLRTGDFSNLDMTKLKGSANIFRVRKGAMRIIFEIKTSSVDILSIDRRNDNTYRDF